MIRVIILLFFISVLNSCTKDDESEKIQTVTIGNQVWMAKNLDVSNYRNGDPIPQITDLSRWNSLTTGAWCYYKLDPANGQTYGKLYNWYAVNDPRGLAPNGWHIPTDNEWWTLVTNLGGEAVAGGKMKNNGTSYWKSPNTGATNSSGFNALPGGYLNGILTFDQMGIVGSYWTSTQVSSTAAYSRTIVNYDPGIFRGVSPKEGFVSVRCVKN